MEFETDIFSLGPPSKKSFSLEGLKIPQNLDIYYRAKQKELLDQYAAARLFMRETETNDWTHWFESVENPSVNEAFKHIMTSYFYETSLLFYNIVVDLSWTLCYVSAEFACTQNGNRVPFVGMKSIEDAAELLRKAENSVTSPTAETNPFAYLKIMCPEFKEAIDLIVEFWSKLCSTSIRSRYNFCKHKGKPTYTEIEDLRGGRLFNLYIQKTEDNEKSQIASDIRDVQLEISLKDAVEELRNFDDKMLFPYIAELFKKLEDVIQPSPLI